MRLLAGFLLLAATSCGYTPPTEAPDEPNTDFDPRGKWVGTWTAKDGVASGALQVRFFLYSAPGFPGNYTQTAEITATGDSCGPLGDTGRGGYGSAGPKAVSFGAFVRDAAAESEVTTYMMFYGEVANGVLSGDYATFGDGICYACGCDLAPLGSPGTWRVHRQ